MMIPAPTEILSAVIKSLYLKSKSFMKRYEAAAISRRPVAIVIKRPDIQSNTSIKKSFNRGLITISITTTIIFVILIFVWQYVETLWLSLDHLLVLTH